MPSFKEKMTREVLQLGLAKAASLPIGVAVTIILARNMSATTFGHYSLVLALLPLAVIFISGGSQQLLSREFALINHSDSWINGYGLVQAAQRWTVIALAIAVTVVTVFTLSSLTNITDTSSISPYLTLVIAFIVARMTVHNGVLRGLQRPTRAEFPLLVVQPIVMLILATAIAISAGQIYFIEALLAYLASMLFALLISKSLYQRISDQAAALRSKPASLALTIPRSLPFFFIALVGIANSQSSVILTGFLHSATEAGYMRLAERLAIFVALPQTIINMVNAPIIAKLYRAGDTKRLQRLISVSTRTTILLSLPIAALLIFFGGQVISITAGSKYAPETAIPLAILVIAQLGNIFSGPVGVLLTMSGHERKVLLGQGVSLIFSVALGILLIPIFGAMGGAIAAAVGMICWNFILLFVTTTQLKISTLPFRRA